MSADQNKKTLWPIEKLVSWKDNPRYIDDKDKERLKQQLLKFGQYKPLLITIEGSIGVILGGNMRLTAIKELIDAGHEEFKQIWVAIVDAPDDKTKLEYALSDNDRAGKYDEKRLTGMIDTIPDFNTDLYSIDSRESMMLDDVVDRYSETEEDEFDAEEEKKKIETPISKAGMVWELGDHRLMCGDSTKPEDVERLMGGASAQMAFTDPPYNVDYSGKGKKTSNKILNDKMDPEQFLQFLTDAFTSYRMALSESAPMYVCYASSSHREFENSLEACGYKVKAQIIWAKALASMGWGDYRWKHEPILYCSLGGKKVPFYGDRKQVTTWDHEPSDAELLVAARDMLQSVTEQGSDTIWNLARDTEYEHPTQKPIKLIEIALKNSSKPGDIVLDLFGGSGSTLMACQQLERKCYSMELDPKYCDVIVRRWERFTKQTAKVAETKTVE